MVRIFIFIFFVKLSLFNAFCQEVNLHCSTKGIFNEPEQLPNFKGGHKQLICFIINNMKYPESAVNDSIEGVVYVNFIVDTNGITINHKIIQGIREDLDQEAIRIAKLIRFETPAMIAGRPIIYSYSLPIRFILKGKKKK